MDKYAVENGTRENARSADQCTGKLGRNMHERDLELSHPEKLLCHLSECRIFLDEFEGTIGGFA